MLATLVQKPFHRAGWVYEEKYDGIRILAYKEGSKVTLMSRNAKDRTAGYAGIAAAVGRLRAETLLIDGEVVVFDRHNVSRFQLLQQGSGTVAYAVFDCLYRAGEDLRSQPLSARRMALEDVLRNGSPLFLSRRLAKDGLEAYRLAKEKGYEGLVAKDLASPYVEGRSKAWLKVKVHQEEEFIIVGYTAPRGSRKHLGALLLGAYGGQELHYVGKVGTGFSSKTLADLWKALSPLALKAPSVINPAREKAVTYVKPKLVAQIAFEEWTADRKLRQPVYLGLRDDKDPRDVVM